MERLCKTCGKTYDSSSGYCPFCGSKDFDAVAPKVDNRKVEPKKTPEEKIIKTRTNLNTDFSSLASVFWVIGLLTLLAGIGLAIYMFIEVEILSAVIVLLVGVLCSVLSFGLDRACKAIESAHDRIDALEKELNKIKSKR